MVIQPNLPNKPNIVLDSVSIGEDGLLGKDYFFPNMNSGISPNVIIPANILSTCLIFQKNLYESENDGKILYPSSVDPYRKSKTMKDQLELQGSALAFITVHVSHLLTTKVDESDNTNQRENDLKPDDDQTVEKLSGIAIKNEIMNPNRVEVTSIKRD